MEFGCFLTATLFLCVIWLCYRYLLAPCNYWEKQGVPSVPAVSILGSMLPFLRQGRHEFQLKAYKKYGRVFGLYESTKPVLYVGEPELIRLMFSKDSHIFPDRKSALSGDTITDKTLGQLKGQDWKRVRSILNPVFTAGKLKMMVNIVADSATALVSNLNKVAQSKSSGDMKKFFGAYALDVIASCVLAIKFDSFNDPENKFVSIAKKVAQPDIPWRTVLIYAFPALQKLLRINPWGSKDLKFFGDIVLNIFKDRKKTGQRREDFLQLLIDIADESSPPIEEKKGNVSQGYDDANDLQQPRDGVKKLTTGELKANCVVFLLAGFFTTSSTLAFLAYSLALNPDVQDKLVAEVDEVIKKHNDEITYDTLQDLEYMDMVINETLRMYPIVPAIDREAMEDYKLGDTGITIPKGMVVYIPIYSIHRDPEFYPDPERFDPERFSAEEKANRNQYTFLPFGGGRRHCIGMRFAIMEIKISLIFILRRFIFKRCSQTKVPMKYRVAQRLLVPEDITLSVEERI